jgi:hypothetical protein
MKKAVLLAVVAVMLAASVAWAHCQNLWVCDDHGRCQNVTVCD